MIGILPNIIFSIFFFLRVIKLPFSLIVISEKKISIRIKINKVVYQMESSTLDFLDLLNEPAE